MSRDLTNQSANQLLWGGITVPSYNFIRHVVAEISGGGVHPPSTNHVCKMRSPYEGLREQFLLKLICFVHINRQIMLAIECISLNDQLNDVISPL